MPVSVKIFLILWFLPLVSFGRIGDSLEQLKERYGTPEEIKTEDGGLLVYKYAKDGLNLWFYMLKDKAEKVFIMGNLSQKEAEVLMARNVPAGTTFTLDENPLLPVLAASAFEKAYTFSDKSTAHLIGKTGWGQLTIQTPKMVAFEVWQNEEKKKKELADANNRIDRIESKAIEEDSTKLKTDETLAHENTPLGAYQKMLYSAISTRWKSKTQQTMAQIEEGQVTIKFLVNPDGVISDLDIIEGNPNSILGLISTDSIQQSSKLIGPFPAELKKEKPKGFNWKMKFGVEMNGKEKKIVTQ